MAGEDAMRKNGSLGPRQVTPGVIAVKKRIVANLGKLVQQGLPLLRFDFFKSRTRRVKTFAFHSVRPDNLMRIKHQMNIRHFVTCVLDANRAVIDQIARRHQYFGRIEKRLRIRSLHQNPVVWRDDQIAVRFTLSQRMCPKCLIQN